MKILRGGSGGIAPPGGESVDDLPVSLRQAFERWQKANPRSEGTYKIRHVAITMLARGGIITLEDATNPRLVGGYIESRAAAGIKPGTTARDIFTIAVVLSYLVKTGEVLRSTYEAILALAPRPKKRKKFSAEILEPLEIEDLHMNARLLGLKELALAIRIVQYAGLRTGELLSLCVEHVDLARRQIVVQRDARVRGASGHKTGERLVPIVNELLPILREELPERGPVFPCHRFTKSGRTVRSAEGLRDSLRRVAGLTGIKRVKVDFRILRRCRESTWAALPSMPRNYLGMIMGHDPEIGEEFYQRCHAGYNAICESPPADRTTKTLRRPQGYTPTRPLTPDEVTELRELERQILARRERSAQ